MKAELTLEELLDQVARGETSPADAARFLNSYGFVEVGYHRLDLHRPRRTSMPEIIYGKSKPVEQLREIIGYFVEKRLPLLVTKVDAGKAAELAGEFPGLEFDPTAGLLRHGRSTHTTAGSVAVITAGSSDLPIAEEAVGTLEFFGVQTTRAFDCGV